MNNNKWDECINVWEEYFFQNKKRRKFGLFPSRLPRGMAGWVGYARHLNFHSFNSQCEMKENKLN